MKNFQKFLEVKKMGKIVFKASRKDLYDQKGNIVVQISKNLFEYFHKNLLQSSDRFWSALIQRRMGGGLLCGN